MILRTYGLGLAFILSCGTVFSQAAAPAQATAPPPRTANLRLVTRISPDSIVLRWAPTTSGAWLSANARGYDLRRVTLDANGKPVPGSVRQLTPTPLKPWPLEMWKQRAPRTDQYAGIAAQSLYGKEFASKGNGISGGSQMRDAANALTDRYSFSLVAADNDPIAAEGLALRYADHDVKRGFTYVYRLAIARKDSSYRIDTAFAVASPAPHRLSPPIRELTAESQERAVQLSWKNLPLGQSYSGFFISRSDDGGNHYVRLNRVPFAFGRKGKGNATELFYTDTTAVNYHKYRYRVEGVTPFAELSEPAEVDAFASDRTPPPPPIIAKPVQLSPRAFRISWEMPKTSPDLAGFAIYRSGFALKGYHLLYPPAKDIASARSMLLPPSTRSFVDSPTVALEPYYIVGAVDTAGNMGQSLPAYGEIVDSTPPAMPTGLKGSIDSTGIVRLSWRLGPEANIIGYRVEWANDLAHEFSMRTNEAVADTNFVDSISLNTLTRSIFYRVIAVNARKIFSRPSTVLALRRPDIIPPESPVFTDVRVSDSTVSLLWSPSRSGDVRYHRLSRRTGDDGPWAEIAQLGRSASGYVDRGVTRRMYYEYRIEAIDSSGLVSRPSPTVGARPYDTGVRPGIRDLAASRDAKTHAVTLTWQYTPQRNEKIWFVIYRALGGGALQEIASVDATTRAYEDVRATSAAPYRYAVKVLGNGGIESALSPAVSVTQ